MPQYGSLFGRDDGYNIKRHFNVSFRDIVLRFSLKSISHIGQYLSLALRGRIGDLPLWKPSTEATTEE